MTEPNDDDLERDDRLPPAGDDLPGPEEANRDPGADLDAEGVPDVADDSTPGRGEVPDPEEPLAPAEKPTVAMAYGMGDPDDEYPGGLDAELAAEQPDAELAAEQPDAEDAGPDDRTGPAETAALHIEGEEAAEDEGPAGGSPAGA